MDSDSDYSDVVRVLNQVWILNLYLALFQCGSTSEGFEFF